AELDGAPVVQRTFSPLAVCLHHRGRAAYRPGDAMETVSAAQSLFQWTNQQLAKIAVLERKRRDGLDRWRVGAAAGGQMDSEEPRSWAAACAYQRMLDSYFLPKILAQRQKWKRRGAACQRRVCYTARLS